MKFSDKVYDFLKKLSLYWLPALGTLWFALSKIWGLPYGHEIQGTLVAVEAFLAAALGISAVSYNKENKEQGDGNGESDS